MSASKMKTKKSRTMHEKYSDSSNHNVCEKCDFCLVCGDCNKFGCGKELVKKLKPFWEKREKLETEFRKKETKLEKEMNKKLNTGIKLEFFYSDGECCGIGAANFNDRKKFPLIHDSELRK